MTDLTDALKNSKHDYREAKRLVDLLSSENTKLRAENEKLRALLGVSPESVPDSYCPQCKTLMGAKA